MPALDITSEIAAVGAVTDWVADVSRRHVDQARIHDIQIACAEALNNIILHAYRRRTGMPIAISINVLADRVALVLRDRGRELPAAALTREVDGDLDPGNLMMLPESGAGLPLIRACSDNVRYRRVGRWNELTLIFCTRASARSTGQ